jgi:uncharacterized membrane protein
MFAIVAFVLFVIAAIVAFLGKSHADAIAYAGLAFLCLQLVWPFTPWQRAA